MSEGHNICEKCHGYIREEHGETAADHKARIFRDNRGREHVYHTKRHYPLCPKPAPQPTKPRKQARARRLIPEMRVTVVEKPLGLELGVRCQRPDEECGYREPGRICAPLTRHDLFECRGAAA